MSNRPDDESNENLDPLSAGKADEGFGLVAPTGELVGSADSSGNVGFDDMAPRPQAKSDESMRQMAWRGFEETQPDEVDEDPDVSFRPKSAMPQDEMDMTPMVDVVFLLLIFFMVTASFILQQSIETPPAQSDEPSTNTVETPEQEDEYIEVIIDQNNTYYVTTRDSGEEECPSDRELRARIRNAKTDFGAKLLKIRAHTESVHRKVVTAWDAGVANGYERIEVKVTEVDF